MKETEITDLLTPVQVADMLQIHRQYLYNLAHEGKGPERVYVGRHVRYSKSALTKWLNDNHVKQ